MTFFKTFKQLFHSKVDASGLAVFRIFYALVLAMDLIQLFKFRHVVYDDIPFEYGGEMFGGIVVAFNLAVVILLFFGLFTRFATILNYLFGVIIFSSTNMFEYHVHYAYVGINFLLMFMPVSRVFSLDNLIEKLKYTKAGSFYKVDRKVLALNYFVPLFLGVGLVYFDSIFRKFASPMWMDGLGMWLPSSMPMAVWTDTSIVLNQEVLVKFLGYLVIVFETVFIFTFWFKRFRIPYLILGMVFHLGIFITYPIPWFGLAIVVAYLLMVPVCFWSKVSALVKSKRQTYTFYYDAECPLCVKVVVIIRHFDFFNKIQCRTVQGHAHAESALTGISESDLLINIHGVDAKGNVFVGYDAYIALLKHLVYTYPLMLVLSLPGLSALGRKTYRYIAGNRLTQRCTAQNCMIPEYSKPMAETEDFLVKGWSRLNISKKFWTSTLVITTVIQVIIISQCPLFTPHVQGTMFNDVMSKAKDIVGVPAKKALGITTHPVFMHSHFGRYNHIFKIVCDDNQKIVPLLDDNGMVTDSYATGAFWVNHTFRVNFTHLDQERYENGVVRYLRYFEHENGLAESSYSIYFKVLDSPRGWQHDFLRNQIKKPWHEGGKIKLVPGGFSFEWNDAMKHVFEQEKEELRMALQDSDNAL